MVNGIFNYSINIDLNSFTDYSNFSFVNALFELNVKSHTDL